MPTTESTDVRNVILTGPPRSATTLTCFLLNKVPDVVALHEPLELGKLTGLTPDATVDYLERWFADTRRGIRETGSAPSKVENGEIPDNPWGGRGADGQNRVERVRRGLVRIEKPLSSTFLLAAKHPAAFTALLPLLVRHWPCFAIVRNPLGIAMSWNSLGQLHFGMGRLPMGETLDPDLKEALDGIPDLHERQLHILDWCFMRYTNFLPPDYIVRYEAMIESSGGALAVIDPAAASLSEPLSSKNANSLYDRAIVADLADRMVERGGAWEAFYPSSSIRQLAEQMLTTGR